MPRRLVSYVAALLAVVATATGVAASQQRSADVIDGPDVASYQHPHGAAINWHQVARSDKDFAIVKDTESTWYRNPWFHRDYNGARDAGLVRGAYHFATPGYPILASARRQARFFVDHLGDVRTRETLPPALDLETTGGLTRGELVTWAQTFLLEVRWLTGRTPMIYTYPDFWAYALGDPTALARYPLWMAAYRGHQPDPTATLWQYTAGAHVEGIRAAVDMSRFLGAPEQWDVLRDGTAPTAWPAATPGAPVAVNAQSADQSIAVSWLPGDTGSTAITGYRVTATPTDGSVATTVSTGATTMQATVPGLVNGLPYTISVTAVNGRGPGVASDPTSPVTPLVPTALAVGGPTETVYGEVARVAVRLTRPDRNKPLAGQPVTVEQDGQPLAERTTSDNGWVVVNLQGLQHDTDLRFSYTAPSGWHDAQLTVHVLVRNRIYAHLSRSVVHAGRPVTLHGSIRPAVEGITVWTQTYYRGAWHDAGSTTTGPNGTYAFTWAPRDRGKHLIRTVVSWFDGRARGWSATQRLTVK